MTDTTSTTTNSAEKTPESAETTTNGAGAPSTQSKKNTQRSGTSAKGGGKPAATKPEATKPEATKPSATKPEAPAPSSEMEPAVEWSPAADWTTSETNSLTSWSTTKPELNAGRLMRAFVRVNVYLYSKPPNRVSKTINKLGVRFNVFVYQRTQGRIMGRFGDLEALLLTTKGRKTGKPRTIPLGYVFDRGRFIVVAVPGHFDVPGGPKAIDPAWYRNLLADSQAKINIGPETMDVTATTATGAEHDRYWNQFTTAYPFIGEFFKRANRPPPVVILTPNDLEQDAPHSN